MTALERYRLQADPWLSEMLARPAWTAVRDGGGVAFRDALSRPANHFVTAKIAARDIEEVGAFESLGFSVVDIALTLHAERVEAHADTGTVRFAEPGDRIEVEGIAAAAFQFSRFHLDPRLSAALANRIKAAWAANWFLGRRGDGMIVAEERGVVAGFLLLRWEKEACLVIDLIAVRAASRRSGLARAMIGFAYACGTGDGRPQRMTVSTQAANVASIRLYEAIGFRLRDAKFVLHGHQALPTR